MKDTFRARINLRREGGFTLIEIMVVVIIIGLLASIVAPRVIGRLGEAEITKAKAEITNLENAVNLFYMDNRRYPTSEQGLEALVNKPTDPNIRNYPDGGYMPRIPNDPWGNPYVYMNPGNNGVFDIYTLGADQQPGGEGINADIGNWDID